MDWILDKLTFVFSILRLVAVCWIAWWIFTSSGFARIVAFFHTGR